MVRQLATSNFRVRCALVPVEVNGNQTMGLVALAFRCVVVVT